MNGTTKKFNMLIVDDTSQNIQAVASLLNRERLSDGICPQWQSGVGAYGIHAVRTEDILKGFKIGAVDYLTKPFQQAELLAT